ncbi:MAG TPA: glycerate kinase, partial [Acidothermaceae bacterium]|nr:glycerate kinase [Acidothermaceae bacterium]
ARFAALLGGDPNAPGAGAAGGTAFGFAALWGARVVSGAATVADLIGLDDAIARADLVVTGEGRLDASSWRGKVVGEVASRTTAPLAVACGSADGSQPRATHVVSLAQLAGSVEAAMADPRRWLLAAGRLLAERA